MYSARRPVSQDGILFDTLAEPLRTLYRDNILSNGGTLDEALRVLHEPHRVTSKSARSIFYAIFAVLSPHLYDQLARSKDSAGLTVAAFRELRYLTLALKLPTLTLKSFDEPQPLEFAQQLNGIVEFIQFYEYDPDDNTDGNSSGSGSGSSSSGDPNSTVRDIAILTEKYKQAVLDMNSIEQSLVAPGPDGSRAPTLLELKKHRAALGAQIAQQIQLIEEHLLPRAKLDDERLEQVKALCDSDISVLKNLEESLAENERHHALLKTIADVLDDESETENTAAGPDLPLGASIEVRLEHRGQQLEKACNAAKESERQAMTALKRVGVLNEEFEAALKWAHDELKICQEQNQRLATLKPEVTALRAQHSDLVSQNATKANELEILTATVEEAKAIEPPLLTASTNTKELVDLQQRVVQLEEQSDQLEAQIEAAERQYVGDTKRFEHHFNMVRSLRAQVAQQRELLAAEISQVTVILKES